jgi:hypothetical protein
MVNFRQKTHLDHNFFLTEAKAARTGVRATDPTIQMGP